MSLLRCLAGVLLPLLVAVVCADAAAIPATEKLTAQFAAMDGGGWTGADASWSARLADGRIAWFFGDTFIGGVHRSGCRDRATPMVRNSVVLQRPDGSLRTVIGGSAERPAALVPAADRNHWYWPGPPVVAGHEVEVPMADIVRTGPGDWDFMAVGTSLATFGADHFRLHSLTRLPTPPRVNMASAAVTAGRFTYIYGTRDYADGHKEAYLARVPARMLAARWMFWDGRGWNPRPASAAPVLTGVSNQFSVIHTPRGWRLVTQLPMRREILAFAGPSPAGPWSFKAAVARVPEISHGFGYNATIHPEFSADDRWVLGFNVTGDDLNEVFADADLYKPRFFEVEIP